MTKLATFVSASVLAASALTSTPLLAAPVSDEMVKLISQQLKVVNDEIKVKAIKASAIEGLYEVELDNGEVLYSGAKGEHFILGDMFQIKGQRFVNLSDQRKKRQRAETLKGLKADDMVVFSPEGETKSVVYAFTDVDCGYCQKLHSEMADYNKAGIEIRYLAFPRAGIGSRTYNEMVSVWCADDRQQAMTLAKTNGKVEVKNCDNPVAQQYHMGQQFGITGTPALVLEDGSLMPGYVPAERLAAFLQM